MSAFRRRWTDVLALIVLNLLIFSGFYVGGDVFPFDFPATYYALPAYWIASVSAGEWPGWVPYLGMGYPFAANPQSGFFYPAFWIFPALRLVYTLHAASILQALHVLAGAIGMYLLAGRVYRSRPVALVAGCAWLLWGGFYSNAQHPDIVRAFALLPWLLWAFDLDADRVQPRRLARWTSVSAVSWSTLAIPALVYLLCTGAYPGVLIAFLFVLLLFVVVQAWRNILAGQLLRSALVDVVVVSGLLLVGLGMASGFLLPLASFSRELTRSTEYVADPHFRFVPIDVYELVLSSIYLRHKDHAVFAMQLSVVLIPFSVFVTRRTLVRLAPYLAVAGIAIVMSFDSFSATSTTLIQLVPYLGYSRFPVVDYRALFVIPLLLLLCGGLVSAVRNTRGRWVLPRGYAIGLLVLLLLLLPPMRSAQLAGLGDLAITVLMLQLVPALALCLWFVRGPSTRAMWVSVVAATVLSGIPVITDLGVYWHARGGEAAIEERAGISPWVDSRWRVGDLFERPLAIRPARISAIDEVAVSWQGYLAGFFMTGDYGGAVLRARKRIADEPELRAFVEQPSTLVELSCAVSACQTLADRSIALTSGETSFAWSGLEYGRSRVRYHLVLQASALVIENEVYSPGWRARLSTGEQREPVEVDGGLRGWFLPAGDYEVNLSFSTPYIELGLGLAAVAVAIYALCILAFARSRPFARPTSSRPRQAA